MTTIDDLAHRSEVEAEVMRSISFLPPQEACEFLLKIVVKIRALVKGFELARLDSDGTATG